MGTSSSKHQGGVEEVTEGVKKLSIATVKDDGGGTETTPGFVYMIEEARVEDGNYPRFYKIGRSVDPTDRRKDLQTGNPRHLEILKEKQVNDPVSEEGRLKIVFRAYKCPEEWHGGTEWLWVRNDSENETFMRLVNAELPQLH